MTEQVDLDALIAEANRLLAENQWTSGWGVESLAERLTDALESTLAELRQERKRADVLERNRSAWIADAFELANAAERGSLVPGTERDNTFTVTHDNEELIIRWVSHTRLDAPDKEGTE